MTRDAVHSIIRVPRVLHLISSSAFLGAESVVLELAKAGIAADHGVIVVSIQNSSNPHRELADAAEAKGIRSYSIPCRGRFDRDLIYRLKEIIRSEHINLIHSHGYKSNFYAWSVARTALPWVVTNHLWKRTTFLLRMYAWLDGFIIRRADRIVAVSDAITAEMISMGIVGGKITVIDNGVDSERFGHRDSRSEIRNNFGFTSDMVVIGTVASLTAEKGHRYLLEAAYDLVSIFPDVRFLFVGEGNQRSFLEQKANELGLRDKIVFAGSRYDIPEILSSLDMFVLPSLNEGLPMALLEAMASAIPVIASKVGAIPRVLEDGKTGLLVDPADPKMLADAISSLLSEPDRRREFASQGFAKVKRDFSADAMATRYFDLYESIFATWHDKGCQ
jgi:glycosyltransferase involved in cell wall biosynthesis